MKKKKKKSLPNPDLKWRGRGGVTPTAISVEYDKQLDNISVWLDYWSHKQVGGSLL
jgi:hypothetical protein